VEVTAAMVEAVWRPCQQALSHALGNTDDEGAVQYLLRAYLSLTTTAGTLAMGEAREGLVKGICKHALPGGPARLTQVRARIRLPGSGCCSDQLPLTERWH
jgi:hypothetical protein